MPSRNVVKHYNTNTYYHVYNRGVDKRDIFLDNEDYAVFLNLVKRYLDRKPHKDIKGREYKWLTGQVDVVAFCLMPNHFHFLLFQIEADTITTLIRSICSAYTTYFNKKYDRVGTLFQGIFKASRIDNESYLMHTTRYIHRNPSNYLNYEWSSLDYWLGHKKAAWVNSNRLNESTPEKYLEYISDEEVYTESKIILDDEFNEG